jgi:hypothetical protein
MKQQIAVLLFLVISNCVASLASISITMPAIAKPKLPALQSWWRPLCEVKAPIWALLIVISIMLFCSSAFCQPTVAPFGNAIKLDLVGLPLGLLTKLETPYPRASIEYERRILRTQKWALDTDLEFSRLQEVYSGIVGGATASIQNSQKSITILFGPRAYPFRKENNPLSGIFFVDLRLGLQRSVSRITPYTTADPITYIHKWFILPRLRLGFVVPVTKRLGFDLSGEAFVQKQIGSNKTRLGRQLELNFIFNF